MKIFLKPVVWVMELPTVVWRKVKDMRRDVRSGQRTRRRSSPSAKEETYRLLIVTLAA